VNKALTIKSGQTHVQRYMKPLLARIENGEIDPTLIISHRVGIDDVPDAFEMFRNKEDDCIKVVVNMAS
jgi:threonine dehydrogenase-like Zn-dependent dehydrogenase